MGYKSRMKILICCFIEIGKKKKNFSHMCFVILIIQFNEHTMKPKIKMLNYLQYLRDH